MAILASWVNGPSSTEFASAWTSTASSAVRSSCAGALGSPVELVTTKGRRGSAAPGWEMTMTASIASRSGRPSISSRTPAPPTVEPLTEASTNVFEWLTRNALASSTRIPVAAAVDAAPGPGSVSRAAARTMVVGPSPGSVSRTLRSGRGSPSISTSYRCSVTAPPGISSKRLATRSAVAASARLPGGRSGAVVAIWRAMAAARSPSKVVGGVTGSSASGAPSSENIATTIASAAGRKARR